MSERDKFLSEAMGICWHSKATPFGTCPDCGLMAGISDPITADRIKFNTWEGFGILWTWAIRQEWWWAFVWDEGINKGREVNLIDTSLINPDKFADVVYEFLEERK